LDIPNSLSTPEIKIPILDELKFNLMAQFVEKAIFQGGDRITLDGLRIEFPFGFGLLRASNTTPCLVARFEAIDEASLLKIQAMFKSQLLAIEPLLEVPF
jgi:phosphomannomutase